MDDEKSIDNDARKPEQVNQSRTHIVILYLNQRETPILLVYTLDSPPVHNITSFILCSYIVQAMQVIYFGVVRDRAQCGWFS